MGSGGVAAGLCEGVDVAAESALEDVLGLDFNSLRTLVDLVADLRAVVADVELRVAAGKHLVDLLRAVEVLLHEDLRVVVQTFAALFAEPVHVVPAELAHDVLQLAGAAQEAEPHVEVGTALVDVAQRAVVALLAAFPHEVGADLQVVAEVALVPVPAGPHALELVAGLDLALVVRVRAVVGEAALPVDELLADAVGGQLVVVRGAGALLVACSSLVDCVVLAIALRGLLLLFPVHLIISSHNNAKPPLLLCISINRHSNIGLSCAWLPGRRWIIKYSLLL